MAKTYRTANGKTVDIGALLNQNENVRAVGNMNVNARGDTIGSDNTKIQSRTDRVKKQYQKQVKRNTGPDMPIYSSKRAAIEAEQKLSKKSNHEAEIENQDDSNLPVSEPAAVDTQQVAKGGLAAAIAKAREVKQEPLKTPRQIAKEQQGVKKI
jgi:hypothetical protein